MAFILNFLYKQLFVIPPYPKHDFTGQAIIVTGSNVGLGMEAARHFVRLNAEKVILAVRSVEKGEKAKASIEESTGKQGVAEVWSLDLSSYESVKEFVRKAEGLKRLDAIVENAGIATRVYNRAEDNEATITTNVVSTFLLALMILPKLRETATKYNVTPRLTIVSSEVHNFTPFTERNSPSIFDKLNDKATADMVDRYKKAARFTFVSLLTGIFSRYNVSKLLEVLYCRELAAKMTESKKPTVTLNFVNPGLCHSELARNSPFSLTVLKFFLARSTEVGSRTLVASACAGHESHGHYMDDSVIGQPSPFVRSEEGAKAQKKVWSELNAKLEKIQPGVVSNV
ncbi:hypothetical protein MMC30_001025 [Trapelia coarctata]|nr:hypothetical protein [Trapelia coarctata]